jgi:hypothetical protein
MECRGSALERLPTNRQGCRRSSQADHARGFAKDPTLKKPVEILKITLEKGPDENRPGKAVVSVGGETLTLQLTLKIKRSFFSDLEVLTQWSQIQTSAPDAISMTQSAMNTTANVVLKAELGQCINVMQKIDATEEVVRNAWNNGLGQGGTAQLAIIRNQIVPLIRETKNHVERFQPISPELRPVKDAMNGLVQHDFSAWINLNNAAAVGKWTDAQLLFDRMEDDRASRVKAVEVALARLNK